METQFLGGDGLRGYVEGSTCGSTLVRRRHRKIESLIVHIVLLVRQISARMLLDLLERSILSGLV